MKKIGIITVYGEYNYGNKLQNYAVMRVYEQLGGRPITIQSYQSALNESIVKKTKRMIKNVISVIPINSRYRYSALRLSKFKSFSKKHLNITSKKWTTKFDSSFFDSFDILSVGSDQVWNDHDYDINDVRYYSLDFKGKYKKVAFAASMGKPSFRKEYEKSFLNGLSSFDLISCREKLGVDYLKELLNKEVLLCCDPTLFLNDNEWKEIAKKPTWLKTTKYSVYYFLGQFTEYKVNESDVDVINLLDQKSIAFTSGPEEFLYLILNAQLVHTDSFHACVFSMIFKKRFIVYQRDDKDVNNQMNSRIQSLFELFDIKKHYNEVIEPEDYLDFEATRKEMVDIMMSRLEQLL